MASVSLQPNLVGLRSINTNEKCVSCKNTLSGRIAIVHDTIVRNGEGKECVGALTPWCAPCFGKRLEAANKCLFCQRKFDFLSPAPDLKELFSKNAMHFLLTIPNFLETHDDIWKNVDKLVKTSETDFDYYLQNVGMPGLFSDHERNRLIGINAPLKLNERIIIMYMEYLTRLTDDLEDRKDFLDLGSAETRNDLACKVTDLTSKAHAILQRQVNLQRKCDGIMAEQDFAGWYTQNANTVLYWSAETVAVMVAVAVVNVVAFFPSR